VPVVWREETAVFARDRVRVERTAFEIAGGQNEIVEAAQDEASPTPLPGKPLKAKDLLLGEEKFFSSGFYEFVFLGPRRKKKHNPVRKRLPQLPAQSALSLAFKNFF
jgi:hypothetical protein